MESSKKYILRQCDWANSQGCLNQEITEPIMWTHGICVTD